MKNYIIFLSIFIFVFILVILLLILVKNKSIDIMANNNPPNITPSQVFATTNKSSAIYDSCNGSIIGSIPENTNIEILKDKSRKWYYIKCKSKKGWIEGNNLNIQEDTKSVKTNINMDKFLQYANKHFNSSTNHYIFVDISRQKIYVLKKLDNWTIEKIITCSTGINKSPTLRGKYKIEDRGEWFYSNRLGSGAKYWVRYCDSYLFHSVAMDKEQNIIDNTLGEKSSNGCVRMSVKNAKWFYDNIEKNTSITIF